MRAIKSLVGAILISIAVFVFWVVILPGYEKRSYFLSVIESRSVNLESKNGLIQKITKLEAEYQSKFAELKRLALVVPAKKDIEEMITILDSISSQSGVVLKKMGLSAQDKGGLNLPYNTVSVELSVSGTYDSLSNLLNSIEKSIRLIDGTEIGLSIDQNAATSEEGLLSMSFKGVAYFIRQEQTNALEKVQAVNQNSE